MDRLSDCRQAERNGLGPDKRANRKSGSQYELVRLPGVEMTLSELVLAPLAGCHSAGDHRLPASRHLNVLNDDGLLSARSKLLQS